MMRKSFIIAIVIAALIITAAAVAVPNMVEKNVNNWLNAQTFIPRENLGKVSYSLFSNTLALHGISCNLPDGTALSLGKLAVSGLPFFQLISGKMTLNEKIAANIKIHFHDFKISVDGGSLACAQLSIDNPAASMPEDWMEKGLDEKEVIDLFNNLSFNSVQIKNLKADLTDSSFDSVALKLAEVSIVEAKEKAYNINVRGLEVATDEYQLLMARHDIKNLRPVKVAPPSSLVTLPLNEVMDAAKSGQFMSLYDFSHSEGLVVHDLKNKNDLVRVDQADSKMSSPLDMELTVKKLLVMPPDDKDSALNIMGYKRLLFDVKLDFKSIDQDDGSTRLEQLTDLGLDMGGRLETKITTIIPADAPKYDTNTYFGAFGLNLEHALLSGIELTYLDDSLVDRLFLYMADGDRKAADELIKETAGRLTADTQEQEQTDMDAKFMDTLAEFVKNPGKLRMAIKIPEPMPLNLLIMQAIFDSSSMSRYVYSATAEPPSGGKKSAPPFVNEGIQD